MKEDVGVDESFQFLQSFNLSVGSGGVEPPTDRDMAWLHGDASMVEILYNTL